MITHFYKIYNKYNEVVYVGVTTRTVKQRFIEHVKSKELNFIDYYCKEFYTINHKNIKTVKDYYEEKEKVKFLERKFIKEELEKGSNLLNISKGGEWCSYLLNKLLSTDFSNKSKEYISFEKYLLNIHMYRQWISSWINNKNIYKVWITNWILHRSVNKYYAWIYNWLNNNTKNKYKVWLNHWISHRNINIYKKWLNDFIDINSKNRYYCFLCHWIDHKTEKFKYKKWLSNFINNKSLLPYKKWLNSFIDTNTKNKYKQWLSHWISHRI